MKGIDDIITSELTLKIGKYTGYSIEACGFCGIVYGICTGDNYTTLSGGFMAYFGTFVHRSFKHLQKYKQEGLDKDKGNIDTSLGLPCQQDTPYPQGHSSKKSLPSQDRGGINDP